MWLVGLYTGVYLFRYILYAYILSGYILSGYGLSGVSGLGSGLLIVLFLFLAELVL